MSRRGVVAVLVAGLSLGACGGSGPPSPDAALASQCREKVATAKHGGIGRALTPAEAAVLTTMLQTAFQTRDGHTADVSLLTDGKHDFYCVAQRDASGAPTLSTLASAVHFPDRVDAGHPTAVGPGLIGDVTMSWGAVAAAVSRLEASWTWNYALSRPTPLPTPMVTGAVIANGYFLAVNAALGDWYPGELAAYDSSGAVIPVSSAPAPSTPPAGSPISYPWRMSAEQDPSGRSATGTEVYFAPGPYRVTLAYHAATTVGRPTTDPSLTCTASAKLALKASPDVPVATLAISHDPATDPAGTVSQTVDVTVKTGALYRVWTAWSCPWSLTVDRVPTGSPGPS